MEIVKFPNKILRQKCEEVEYNTETRKVIKELEKSLKMSKKEGIGLSAPQIGIAKRVYIARKIMLEGDQERYKNIVFVNPKIIKKSKNKTRSLEGCLSIEDTYGYVERAKSIKVVYTDSNGVTKTLSTGGYLSLVIQHEQDHLDGILFIDKLIKNKKYTEEEIDKKLQSESNE
ncbi:peptide deformylase [bacterium]|nr:peptide deformylase [bacterium]